MSKLPVALITGTNSGLGLALTVLLSKTHRVFAGMRSVSKADKLQEALKATGDASNVVVTELDVNSDESVNAAFAKILSDPADQLDLLICNAGYSVFGSVEMLSMQAIKEQFETNLFGVIRCQQAALPTMRKQKRGKIVAISSVGGVWGQPFNDVYCASKFALEGLFESQAALFRTMGIWCTNVQPGAIKTAFVSNAKMPDMSKMPEEYKAPLASTFAAYQKSGGGAQSPEEIADIINQQVVMVAQPPLKLQPNPKIQTVFAAQLSDPTGETGVKMAADRFLKGL